MNPELGRAHGGDSLPGDRARPEGWKTGLCIVLIMVACTVLLTRPPDYIDTFNYAKNIVEHGSKRPAEDPFWDFGHALWRPLGNLVWRMFGFLLQPLNPSPQFQAALGLIALSAASVIACTVFLYFLILRSSQTVWIACLAAYAFMASRFVLDYALTGMAYSMGIALQIASLYYLHGSLQDRRLTASRALLSGSLAGLSVCLWFPYGFTLTGFLLFGLLWAGPAQQEWGRRIRFMAVWAAAIVVIVLAVYLPVAHFREVHSAEEFREWVMASSYGIKPTRGALRAAFAIPRSFVWMGDAGVLFKRFLFDPPQRWLLLPELVNGIWKVTLIYGVLCYWAYRALQTPAGRRLLLCLLLTSVPTMIFAIFMFDPSPPIRYIALYPLLFLGISWVMTNKRSFFGRKVLPAFCLLTGAINLVGMSRLAEDAALAQARARLEVLNDHVAPADRILILTLQDKLSQYVYQRPFDSASRNRERLLFVIPVGTSYLESWKPIVANKSLETWKSGGRLWLSKRMLATAPRPDWNWVEGDERVKWADVPRFFGLFEVASDFGGDDGFVELIRSRQNEDLMRSTVDSVGIRNGKSELY